MRDLLLAGAIANYPEEAAALLRSRPWEEILALFDVQRTEGSVPERAELVGLARLLNGLLPPQRSLLVAQIAPRLVAAMLLAHRGPETRAIVNQLDAGRRRAALDACSDRERPRLERLFASQPGTVAGIMSGDYLQVMEEESVASVRARVREGMSRPDMPIYCVDHGGVLVGVVPPLELVARDANTAIALLAEPVLAIGHLTPVDLLRRPELWGEIQELPVVNRDNRLVGVVRRAVIQPGDHYGGATLGQSLFELLGDYVKVTSELTAITLGKRN